jgi:kynurenine formamidase
MRDLHRLLMATTEAGRVFMAAVAATLTMACSPAPAPLRFALPVGQIVDLSHAYDGQAIFWPTAEPFRLEKVADGVTAAGYYYAANNFFTSEHGGTHIDAPVHFAQGHQTVDQIPIDRLLGEAFVIDVTAQAGQNPDYQVTSDDFQGWERAHGPIPAGGIVLLRTGFSSRWPDAVRYLGTAERGEAGAAKLHFPGLHPEAARWLMANRSIKAIGIDTASIDYGQSMLFESHRLLYAGDIPAFENLTALDRLPPRGALVIALPMKIKGGSGAPLRAIGIVPPQ